MKKFFCIAFVLTFLATGLCASSAFAQTIQTSPDTQSLIADLQSLSATLNDIQKQIQKLAR